MTKTAAISAILAILVLGVLVGILGTHLFYAQKLRSPGSFSMMASQFFADRLDRELSLTDEQRAAIGAILDETRLEADALRDDLRPKVGALMEEASERISEILTPEQRQRYADLRERHRGRAEHFLLGPPGPPHWRGHRRPPWRDRPAPPPAGSEEVPTEDRPQGPKP